MTGNIDMGLKRLKQCGEPLEIYDASRLLENTKIGQTSLQYSIPIMTSNVTGSYACSVTPSFDGQNVYKVFDRNVLTEWKMDANTFTILLQSSTSIFDIDAIRIIKTGTIIGMTINIGTGSAVTKVAEIDTVDDDGIFYLSSRYAATNVTFRFATSGGAIYEIQMLSGTLNVGKELLCHMTNNPLSVPNQSFVNNYIDGIVSYISPSYATVAFTASSTAGYICVASDQLPSNPGWYALDRQANTFWVCQGIGSQTLDITCPSLVTINAVQIMGRVDDSSDNFDRWSIEAFDGSTWTELLSVQSPPPNRLTTYTFDTVELVDTYRFIGTCATNKASVGLTSLNYTFNSINCNDNRLTNVQAALNNSDAVNRAQLNIGLNARLPLTGGLMSGNILFTSGQRSIVISETPGNYTFPMSLAQSFFANAKQFAISNILSNPLAYLVLNVSETSTTPTESEIAATFSLLTVTGNMPARQGSPDFMEFTLQSPANDEITVTGAGVNQAYVINGLFLVTNEGFDSSPSYQYTVTVHIGGTSSYVETFTFTDTNWRVVEFAIRRVMSTESVTVTIATTNAASGLTLLGGILTFASVTTSNQAFEALQMLRESFGTFDIASSPTLPTTAGSVPHIIAERLSVIPVNIGAYISYDSNTRIATLSSNTLNTVWRISVVLNIQSSSTSSSVIYLQICSTTQIIAVRSLTTNERRSTSIPSHDTLTFNDIMEIGPAIRPLYIRAYASASNIHVIGGYMELIRLPII